MEIKIGTKVCIPNYFWELGEVKEVFGDQVYVRLYGEHEKTSHAININKIIFCSNSWEVIRGISEKSLKWNANKVNKALDRDFAYIRRTYNVPAYKGAKIKFLGKSGEIVKSFGNKIGIRLDGENLIMQCHPTWEMEYLK